MKKISEFLPQNFKFLVVKFSICMNRRVFVMTRALLHEMITLSSTRRTKTNSRVSQFLYFAKKKKKKKNTKNVILALERYMADFCIYKAWIFVHTKSLYSNAKLIAFWRNTSILHATGLKFCQATVSCIKRIVSVYTILTGKRTQCTPNSR